MRVEKCVLNDALRVLGKVVCQTSPVELYRSVRFVGDGDGGDDFFLYGSPETWGHDTIYQTVGTVSLLFVGNGETILEDEGVQVDYDEKNNVTTYTFDANNSITFVDLRSGQINVVKRPVDAPYFGAAYTAGGFDSYSSRKVFNTPAILA